MSSPGASTRPRWQIVLLLMLIATTFGSNHIAARIAFDHGLSVPAAVGIRSFGTAFALFLALRIFGIPPAAPRPVLMRAILVGLLVAVQSYCLYSAVARIQVGLALLTFNSFPFQLACISWVMEKRRPTNRTLIFMAVALAGLALALSPGLQGTGAETSQRLAGIAYAFGAAFAFAWVLFLSQRWLGGMDGRLRSMVMILTTGIAASVAGVASDTFTLPGDMTGWLCLALLTVLYGTAFSALFIVLPRYGILDNAAVMNFEPIAALLMGVIILGQTITPLQTIGAAIVLAAMLGFASGGRKPAPG